MFKVLQDFDECKYEEQIAILQDKLKQTHNKLIEQLDICRNQELTIIDLINLVHKLQENNAQKFCKDQNLIQQNYESFGINELKKGQKQQKKSKEALLQTDLQAMRIKLLTQITEKNSLYKEISQIKNKHQKQILQLKQTIEFLSKQNQLAKQEELLNVKQRNKTTLQSHNYYQHKSPTTFEKYQQRDNTKTVYPKQQKSKIKESLHHSQYIRKFSDNNGKIYTVSKQNCDKKNSNIFYDIIPKKQIWQKQNMIKQNEKKQKRKQRYIETKRIIKEMQQNEQDTRERLKRQ